MEPSGQAIAALSAGAVLEGTYGHYEVVGELRRGGMGAVLLVRHGEQGHAVAKVALKADDHTRARFDQELKAMGSLDHPQVVSARDSGVLDGHPWYLMDHVGTANLADLLLVRGVGAPADLPSLIDGIAEGLLPSLPPDQRIGLGPTTAVALLRDVAEAVAHAHSRGVLHRDLKPANVLIDERGKPVLCDFGVARDLNRLLHLTAVDEVVGTMAYIAPEQLAGDQVDERADVYGLGAILYESLCGQPPPRRLHGLDKLPGLADLRPPLRRVVDHALQPDPARRCPSARVLAADLARIRRGEPVRAPGRPLVRRLLYRINRHPVLTGVSLALVLVVLVAGALLIDRARRSSLHWLPSQSLDLRQARLPDNIPGRSDWQFGARGLSMLPNPDNPAHASLLLASPPRFAQRVEVIAESGDGSQEIGCSLGSDGPLQGGYAYQIGAYENSCSLLRRGIRVLWMGDRVVEPDTRYEIVLERVGDRLRVLVNGVEEVSLRDPLPWAGNGSGPLSWRQGSSQRPAAFEQVHLLAGDLPDLVAPEWRLVRYGLLAESSSGLVAADIIDEGIAVAGELALRLPEGDPRRDDLVLRQAALLAIQDGSGLARFRNELDDLAQRWPAAPEVAELRLFATMQEQAPFDAVLAAALDDLDRDGLLRVTAFLEQRVPLVRWEHFLEVLLERIGPRSAAASFLLWRVLGLQVIRGDYEVALATRQRLAENARDDFWGRRARVGEQLAAEWLMPWEELQRKPDLAGGLIPQARGRWRGDEPLNSVERGLLGAAQPLIQQLDSDQAALLRILRPPVRGIYQVCFQDSYDFPLAATILMADPARVDEFDLLFDVDPASVEPDMVFLGLARAVARGEPLDGLLDGVPPPLHPALTALLSSPSVLPPEFPLEDSALGPVLGLAAAQRFAQAGQAAQAERLLGRLVDSPDAAVATLAQTIRSQGWP